MTTAFLKDITALKPGAPVTRGGVTLIPIFAPAGRASAIKIAGDELVVSELETPTVPELQVHNPTAHDLLIPAGRILSGGRQTRVVNVSIVVPAGAKIVIPVSCVEAGRWSGRSGFANSGRNASRRMRVAKQRSVKNNIDRNESKRSAQGDVWNTIDHELSSRSVHADASLFIGALPGGPRPVKADDVARGDGQVFIHLHRGAEAHRLAHGARCILIRQHQRRRAIGYQRAIGALQGPRHIGVFFAFVAAEIKAEILAHLRPRIVHPILVVLGRDHGQRI